MGGTGAVRWSVRYAGGNVLSIYEVIIKGSVNILHLLFTIDFSLVPQIVTVTKLIFMYTD